MSPQDRGADRLADFITVFAHTANDFRFIDKDGGRMVLSYAEYGPSKWVSANTISDAELRDRLAAATGTQP